MSDYIEPQQTDFDNAEQVLLDIIKAKYPTHNTKSGSVVKELLIRPLAYLYSWLLSNYNNTTEKSSVAYLRSSQLTENSVADRVASNYFVTRASGTVSKGVLTLVLNTGSLVMEAYTPLLVNGVHLVTYKRVIASGSERYETSDTVYVPVTPYDQDTTLYMARVPVYAPEKGYVDIPVGAVLESIPDARIEFGFISAAVTGGGDAETDADMLARAEYNTAQAGVGSVYGIRKLLSSAPVTVLDAAVVTSSSYLMQRDRNNTTGIGAGGAVDCYVKTRTAPRVGEISGNVTEAEAATTHELTIDDPYRIYSGLYKVNSFIIEYEKTEGGNTVHVKENIIPSEIIFKSSSLLSPENARLGSDQLITVKFNTSIALRTFKYTADVMYAPDIYTLQSFLDEDNNRFIGQTIYVKAAVPVDLKIACVVESKNALTDDVLNNVKTTMSSYVCGLPVGSRSVNFSDIRKVVAESIPGVDLKLPCNISADVLLKNGAYTWNTSSTGMLDIGNILNEESAWSYRVCYFSLLTANIRLEKA